MSNSTSSLVAAWLRLMLAAAACVTDPTPGSPACATALGGAAAPKIVLGPVLDFAGQQLRQTLKDFPAGSEQFPGRETEPDGRWPTVEDTNWVSGFHLGCLWQMHGLTGDAEWAEAAASLLPSIESVQNYTGSHDVGFIFLTSFGDALEALPADAPEADARWYRSVILNAAASLAQRFNPRLGLFRSWGANLNGSEFKMMNLQLMWTASEMPGGQPEWRDMAVRHAKRTAQDFFRGDGSTWHKIIYDADSSSLREKATHQGFSANSTWTRGQAWALHGFTEAYAATREPLFLSTAQAAADLLLGRLSKDWVPVWDFDAPQDQAWKDSSAGAVAAAGLLRLAEVVAEGDVARGVRYHTAALRMLHALATGYLADSAPELALASVLRNATLGALGPGGGTMFGDYYFLEALAYQQRQQQAEQVAEASVAAG